MLITKTNPNLLLVDCDGSFSPQTGIASWAWIDGNDNKGAGLVSSKYTGMSAATAETVALIQAINSHKDSSLLLLTDSLFVIDHLWSYYRLKNRSDKESLKELRALIKSQISSGYDIVVVKTDNTKLHRKVDYMAKRTRKSREARLR